MLDSKFFDELAQKLSDAMPSSFKDIKTDMEKNFKAVLQSTFAKLDLVTREEFDVQVGVLKKTRSKLEKLEKHIAELEKQLKVKKTK
ncbi:MAG: accessory factor UbiK family protein [Pseudomonadota bacterium]